MFFASVAIFMFVSCKAAYFLARTDPTKSDRRRGFSNRAIAAMFVTTVINFLLSSLNAGIQVVLFIVFIRKALILDLDFPFSEKSDLVDNALQNMDIIADWARFLPVSIELSLRDPVSANARCR